MKVWIDILTPKQLLFLELLAQSLEKKGCKIYLTTRNYREITHLVDLKGLNIEKIGRHGGASLNEKLWSSSKRVMKLSKREDIRKADLAVSFSSVEASRVAFGLNIPHLCISDSPHAEAVSKLTIPLSSKLYTPWIIPKEAWTCYGIAEESINHYRALDPAAWLKRFTPSLHIREDLHLSSQYPIIVFRPEEEQAAYMVSQTRRSPIPEVLEDLIKSKLKATLIVLPRYQEQYLHYKKIFGSKILIPKYAVDGVNLLNISQYFVGAGGTMTCEAALLGVPSLSCYPLDPTYVERFLIKEDLIQRSLETKTIVDNILHTLENDNYAKLTRKKAYHILESMEDPIEIITNFIVR